ncbi:MAG TPA: oxygen-independent coproporphyrinogen III oxidase [Myxococcota bacterium]|nr:oxygen-independent coproporphyrinogen III oxidase [Myxococcota bacterium]
MGKVTISSQDPRRIDPRLREKYDVRGPRYTSYPPANHFHALDAERVFVRWRERNDLADDPGLSLYLHIPFCRRRCLFCGCHTFVASRPEKIDDYTRRLTREMNLAAGIIDPSRLVRQIAMGGGTPNALSEEQLDSLLSALRSVWTIAPEAELSVEINPRTATPGKLDVFLSHGFNRFSLGIQDFTPSVLEIVKRDQGLMEVDGVVSQLRSAGVQSINFDLIYGLPGQSQDSCLATAEKVIALAPSRIALYSYAHVPWIHAHQKALERIGLPEPEVKASLFLSMMDRLMAAGYLPIGMDHLALPDDPLAKALGERTLRRNFMGYTAGRGLDLLAFGASAISSIGTAYSQDEKGLSEYAAGIEAGNLPIARGFLLERDDEIRRELILDLFCNFHADLDSLSGLFEIRAAEYLAQDLERLAELSADGLVNWDEHSINVTDSGRFFIRNICMNFDRYLEHDPGKRVYSRTI